MFENECFMDKREDLKTPAADDKKISLKYDSDDDLVWSATSHHELECKNMLVTAYMHNFKTHYWTICNFA